MGDRDGADADQGSIHRHRSLRQRGPSTPPPKATNPAALGAAGGGGHTKSPVRGTGRTLTGRDAEALRSGAEAGGFDQTDLIATGGELPPLVALDHDPTSGLDPDDPGPDPAKGGRFQHLDHITGL